MSKRKEENIIGTKIGIYEILYECDFKSNDGHRMCHVKCSECGWETNKQMHQIKYVKECKHKDRFGNYAALGKILVKEFIKRRMENPDKIRSYPKQSWMNVYGLE